MIEEHGLADYPICALGFAAAAAVRAHHGRLDEAKRDLRRSIDLLAAFGDFAPWYGAEARILLAHASLALADVVRARTLLAEASRLARRVSGAVIFEHWFDDAWSQMDALAETSLAGPSSLTIAELRILRFLPSHRSFREIATQLGVSGQYRQDAGACGLPQAGGGIALGSGGAGRAGRSTRAMSGEGR